jgi:hypothetical protein
VLLITISIRWAFAAMLDFIEEATKEETNIANEQINF